MFKFDEQKLKDLGAIITTTEIKQQQNYGLKLTKYTKKTKKT